MKKNGLTLCKGFTGLLASVFVGAGFFALETAQNTCADGETAYLSALVCSSAEIGENMSVFTANAEGTEGFEYTSFTGTATVDGEEKSVALTVLNGQVEFLFDYAIASGYFTVNADTVYSDGVNELRFECGYACDFYAYKATPVSVLYNPEWENTSDLTATCGALLYGESNGVASGYASVDGKSVATSLTVDGDTGLLSFSFSETPEKFTVSKNAVFIGENAAFCFDVSYLFDVKNGRILPSEATVTVYDGDVGSSVTVEVGSAIALPSEGTGKGLVGFFDGKTLYPAGGLLVVDGPQTLRAVYLETVTANGASVRLESPRGIRFTTSFVRSDYETLMAMDGVSVSFGAEIFVDGSAKVLNVPTDPISLYERDGKQFYHTAIVNVQTKNFALVYECRPYVAVTYPNGETRTVYGTGTKDWGGETGRSYAQVLALAYASIDDYDEDSQTAIKALHGEVFSAVGVQPVALVYVNGERSNEFNAELSNFLNGSAWRIGDEIDLTAFFEDLSPNGYQIGENSVLKGVITNRGLTLEVYYEIR